MLRPALTPRRSGRIRPVSFDGAQVCTNVYIPTVGKIDWAAYQLFTQCNKERWS